MLGGKTFPLIGVLSVWESYSGGVSIAGFFEISLANGLL